MRWQFIMPEHTGTRTVTKFFHEALFVKTCFHDHEDFPPPSSIDFAFAFARNPYQRLVSSAAYHGVISGRIVENVTGNEAEKFRQWIRTFDGDGPKNRRLPPIHVASEQYARAPMRYIGRTSDLARGLINVLGQLGYGEHPAVVRLSAEAHRPGTLTPLSPSSSSSSSATPPLTPMLRDHCISSCHHGMHLNRSTNQFYPTRERDITAIRWFDDAAARWAQHVYAGDFQGNIGNLSWSFSRDPSVMWEDAHYTQPPMRPRKAPLPAAGDFL
jgi:hypothetical protein